jgi:ATP-dependent Clp protease adaptor protein ClpS
MTQLSRPKEEYGLVVEEETQVKPPRLYKVLLINDDYTPMDFVVDILERIFDKDHAVATDLMLKVHQDGSAVCGVYTYDIAETKVAIVTEEALQKGYPLQCIMEKE